MPLSPDIVALLRDRFDALDKRMDSQDAILRRVEKQVNLTNGRVTALETKEEVAHAINSDRATREVRKTDRYRFAITAGIGGVAAVLGGLGGAMAHALGWW